MKGKGSKINLALIGLGSIGAIHAAVLERSTNKSGITLKAIADLKRIKGHSGIVYHQDYREVLQEKDIVAISIATPPNTHYQIALDALEAGKNVLLEKPPTLSMAALEELTDIAIDKKLVLFTAFHACYHPEVALARQELKNKIVRRIEINYAEYVLNYHDPSGWIFDPKIAGGGVLMDSGINAMSIIREVLPEIEFQVKERSLLFSPHYKVETKARVNFAFGEGGQGILQMDWFHKGRETREVIFYTDDARYRVDIVQNQLFKNDIPLLDRGNKERIITDLYSEYTGVYEDFAKHLSMRKSLISEKELKFVLDVYPK